MAGIITSRRRWYGLLFLLLALGMVIWGQTWLRPYLYGVSFIVYWCICLAWTMLALATGLIDAQVTRRQLRQQQLDLLRETLDVRGGEKRGSGAEKGRKEVKVGREED